MNSVPSLFYQLLVLSAEINWSFAEEWSYSRPDGLRKWCDVSENCCGDRQSPVDIPERYIRESNVNELQFNREYHNAPDSMVMTNTGHTVSITIPGTKQPRMRGGHLRGAYIFNNLHFHWGNSSNRGSEHTIDGRRFPIEAHLVHYSERFDNLNAAVASGEKDALAVLGVFFVKGDRRAYNQKFTRVSSQLRQIEYKEMETKITPFALVDILPSDDPGFYRYFGSLTTPDCNEVVVWTVFADAIPITWQSIAAFREIYSTNENEIPQEYLVDNFRPTQRLNDRRIIKLYPERYRHYR